MTEIEQLNVRIAELEQQKVELLAEAGLRREEDTTSQEFCDMQNSIQCSRIAELESKYQVALQEIVEIAAQRDRYQTENDTLREDNAALRGAFIGRV